MSSSRKSKGISRRKFIERGVQGSTVIGLSQTLALPLTSAIGCNSASAKVAHGACYHDCPDTCSWTATAVENKIVKFEASTSNPYTSGKLCAKMSNFPNDVTFHPDRILTPLKRVGQKGEGKFKAISWDQALFEVAEKLKLIIDEKGGEAVLPFNYAGTQGLIQGTAISNRFFAHIGATKLERTICGAPAVTGAMTTNGQTTGVLPEDISYSRFIVLWGTNTIKSNQHLWTLILQARNKGAKIVVVDPFQSQTALEADWHIQLLPGTDTALALGLINVILSENLQDQDYIDKYTIGIQELTAHVQNYNPASVARITGIDEDTILELARAYAKTSPSLIRVLIGMEHQSNGGSAFRAVYMLPALTGAWKQRGGGMMHMTYELFGKALNWDSVELLASKQNPKARSVNMVQIGHALNDTSLNPSIHAMFVYNANPAVTAPNQNLVVKGLKREDLLTVVLEHFLTDTARYADYIFPATSQLEHWDIMDSWGHTYLNLNQPVISPLGDAKSNTEFFRLLAKELSYQETYLYETDLSILKKTLKSDHEYLKGITFESLKNTGWAKLNLPEIWMPHEKGNFGTKSGKCEFYNADQQPPIADYHPKAYSEDDLSRYPLQLLTIKSTKHFLNSSHANVNHLIKKEGKPFLEIHQVDAEARGIADGDDVKAYNQNGQVLITARIGAKVRQGVVCMPQGFWPSLIKGGASANALTSDLLTNMGDGAALQETRVDVTLV